MRAMLEVWISSAMQLVTLDPSNGNNRAAVRRLKPIVEERREKMKEEMIGELQDNFPLYWLGNA